MAEPDRVLEPCSFGLERQGLANTQVVWYYETFEEAVEDRAYHYFVAAARHKQPGRRGNPVEFVGMRSDTGNEGTRAEEERTIPVASQEDTSFAEVLPNCTTGQLESETNVAKTWRILLTRIATEGGDLACC